MTFSITKDVEWCCAWWYSVGFLLPRNNGEYQNAVRLYAECGYTEGRYAECCYGECH